MVHRASQLEWLSDRAGTLEPCCPRCDSRDTRISQSTAVLDFLFRQLLDRVPFRCRNCRLRFYRRRPQQSEVLRVAAAVKRWTDGLRKRPY
jgi:hypothetical protein